MPLSPDMMFKRFSLMMTIAAAVFLTGCYSGQEPSCISTEQGRVWMNFSPLATRSDDDAVSSLDLLAFRSADGTLDAATRSEGIDEVSASLSSGIPLTVYLLANVPPGTLSGISNLNGFLKDKTTLDESISGTLEMIGKYETPGFSEVDNGGGIHIDLERYVAKISLKKVSVQWLEEFTSPPICHLGRIALVNAKGSTARNGESSDEEEIWYNRSCVETGLKASIEDMLIYDGGQEIVKGKPAIADASFYSMPNPSQDLLWAADAPWTPRRSRLAIEIFFDGVAHWYPVDLPVLESNHHYLIDQVSIIGPGAPSPDTEIQRNTISFTISVAPWDDKVENVEFEN